LEKPEVDDLKRRSGTRTLFGTEPYDRGRRRRIDARCSGHFWRAARSIRTSTEQIKTAFMTHRSKILIVAVLAAAIATPAAAQSFSSDEWTVDSGRYVNG
jgi:hypothetical protein